MTMRPLRVLSLSVFLGAFLCVIPGGTAHAAPLNTMWVSQYSSCPAGYADTQILDDTDNSQHHVGEENDHGTPLQHLCVGTTAPGVTVSAQWTTAGGCGANGTGLYDDAGVYSDNDYPSNHALNEANFRPNNPANAQELCLSASGSGSSITTRWPSLSYCSASESYLVGGKYGPNNGHGHNVNSEDREGASQDALCASLNLAQPTATLTANPLSITQGNSTTLSWSSSNATSCSINQGIGAVSTSGSRSVSPSSNTTYTLTCNGAGGTVTSSVNIAVSPTQVPANPTNLNYSCNSAGTQATFTWTATPGADGYYVRHQPVGSAWIDDGTVTGTSKTVNITPNQQYDWWLHSYKGSLDNYSSGVNGARFSCAPQQQVSVPPAPSGLSYTCASDGNSVTLNWGSSSGATGYDVRLDNMTGNNSGCVDGWYCSSPPDHYRDNYGSRSVTLSTTPGQNYRWWVHSRNSAGVSGATNGSSFTCNAAPAPAGTVASCTANTTSIQPGQSVIYTTTGSNPQMWYFPNPGGGIVFSSSKTYTRTYNSTGTFTASVFANGQGVGTDCTPVTVANPAPVDPGFTCIVTPAQTVSTGVPVTWNASTGLAPYTWYPSEISGYINTNTVPRLTRTYNTPGTYGMSYEANWPPGDFAAPTCPLVTVTGASGCSTGTPAVTITATPNRVRAGQTSTIAWTGTNVLNNASCTITGPGVNQTVPSGAAPTCAIPNSSATPTINNQSTYTITCGAATASVTVNLVPAFQEF